MVLRSSPDMRKRGGRREKAKRGGDDCNFPYVSWRMRQVEAHDCCALHFGPASSTVCRGGAGSNEAAGGG